MAQSNTFQLLSAIQGTSPKVNAYTIQRKPVIPEILDADQVEEMENLDPSVSANLIRTQPHKLTRAEFPLSFDVVALSRNIAEEESTIAQTQLGEAQEDNDYEDDENDGAEREEYE